MSKYTVRYNFETDVEADNAIEALDIAIYEMQENPDGFWEVVTKLD